MNAQTHSQSVATVQGSLQSAMLAANQKDIAKNVAPINKAPTQSANQQLKSVIVRRDILGSALIFDVDSHVKGPNGEFIKYWDGKPNSPMQEAPIQYYHVSKPLTDPAVVTKITEQFAKHFKHAQLVVRQRLVKDNFLKRDEQGKVNQMDLDAFKLKLIEQVTLAIMAA